MGKKIKVFATSFLDELLTHPEDEGRALSMLKEAAGRNSLELELRCDRSPLKPMTADELQDTLAVIADLETYDPELFLKAGRKHGGPLGLIARYGIGYNNVDVKAANEAGVLVTNTPGANSLPTAEWAITTLLDIAGRRIPHHTRASVGQTKSGPSRLDISGRTLGIIGTGNIGKQVARLLSGFQMKILAADLYPDEEWARENNVHYVDIAEICAQADFITLHASGGGQLIGKKELGLMHPTTALINCARGVLVDNYAVYCAVKTGQLWGYGIDEVWDNEELPLEGLNIAASPHVGSDTDRGKLQMQLMSARAVVDFVDGKQPEYVVQM